MCLDYKNLWQALHDVSCILSFPSIISAPPKFRCPVVPPRPSLSFLLVLTLDPPVRVHPPFWCGGLPETQTWHNMPLPPSAPNPGFDGPPQWCYSLPFQLFPHYSHLYLRLLMLFPWLAHAAPSTYTPSPLQHPLPSLRVSAEDLLLFKAWF